MRFFDSKIDKIDEIDEKGFDLRWDRRKNRGLLIYHRQYKNKADPHKSRALTLAYCDTCLL